MPQEEIQKTKSASDENLIAACSYLWLLSVVILWAKKDSEYIKFHAKQGLVLFLTSILFWFIPILGWMLQLAVVAGVIVGFVKALGGEKYRLPLVADLAEKIKI